MINNVSSRQHCLKRPSISESEKKKSDSKFQRQFWNSVLVFLHMLRISLVQGQKCEDAFDALTSSCTNFCILLINIALFFFPQNNVCESNVAPIIIYI